MFKTILSCLLINILITQFAFANVLEKRNMTKNALSIEISDSGFALLGDLAQNQFLKDIKNKKMEDMELSIPLMANMFAKDITYSANFKSLNFRTYNGGLEFDIKISNLVLNIGQIRFENFFMPSIGTSCFNTSINLGNHNTLPVSGKLGIQLKDGKLKLKNDGINFYLAQNQYLASGPSDCRGMFQVNDYLTQFVLKNILSSAQPAINLGVQLVTKLAMGQAGDFLSKKLKETKLPLSVPSLPFIEDSKLIMSLWPEKLSFLNTGMETSLSVGIMGIEKDEERLENDSLDLEILQYVKLGVKTSFINTLLSSLIPGHTKPIEITPDFNEMIESILLMDEFSVFIPDLEDVKADSDVLKAFVSLQAPVITLEKEKNTLKIAMPDIALKLQILRNEKWIDYFVINLNVSLKSSFKITEGKVVLRPELEIINVKGEFSEGIIPTDSDFYGDDLKETFLALFDIIMNGTDEGYSIDLPQLGIEGKKVTFSKLEIVEENILMEFAPAPKSTTELVVE